MKHKLLCFILSLILATGLFTTNILAAEWPDNILIDSDAGIVMDADSGAVLYGKNIHETYAPASITKVLTALIILEKASLDDVITYSQNAVYNVEANSSSAGYDTGDQATVKDSLYAMLLKSANESANALAEHVAGTTEAFAVLMNEKAAALGCQDSHFTNPSGLNDENHYVSAYDMALITKAAFESEMFSKIVATTYYNLPPNKTNPEGMGISPGNKMVKPNWPEQYRPDIIGGKTGYTSIALNTLVNCAQQGDTKLVTVVLHSQATQYGDTKKLLDFGFKNFQSVNIADYDTTYSTIGDTLKISGLTTSDKAILTLDPNSRITLPRTADFSEASAALDYTLPADAPSGAIGRINYTMDDRFIGSAYLTLGNTLTTVNAALPQALLEVQPTIIVPDTDESTDGTGEAAVEDGADRQDLIDSDNTKNSSTTKVRIKIPSILPKLFIGVLILGGIGGGGIFLFIKRQRQEAAEQMRRRQRRVERLKEAGVSEADFNLLVRDKRSGSSQGEPDIKKKRSRPK